MFVKEAVKKEEKEEGKSRRKKRGGGGKREGKGRRRKRKKKENCPSAVIFQFHILAKTQRSKASLFEIVRKIKYNGSL